MLTWFETITLLLATTVRGAPVLRFKTGMHNEEFALKNYDFKKGQNTSA